MRKSLAAVLVALSVTAAPAVEFQKRRETAEWAANLLIRFQGTCELDVDRPRLLAFLRVNGSDPATSDIGMPATPKDDMRTEERCLQLITYFGPRGSLEPGIVRQR